MTQIHVARGGSWSNRQVNVQGSHRSGDYPNFRYHFTGFRLSWSVTPRSQETRTDGQTHT